MADSAAGLEKAPLGITAEEAKPPARSRSFSMASLTLGRARSALSVLSVFTLLSVVLFSAIGSARLHNFQKFANADRQKYLIGVGKADITGPVIEINFAGYANLDQKGSGLRQRLYSRAFIIADASNPNDRFVYLVLDTQSGDTAMRNGLLDGLSALGSEYSVYGQNNIALTELTATLARVPGSTICCRKSHLLAGTSRATKPSLPVPFFPSSVLMRTSRKDILMLVQLTSPTVLSTAHSGPILTTQMRSVLNTAQKPILP